MPCKETTIDSHFRVYIFLEFTSENIDNFEVCFLSKMFHCYKTGIYFDWILKVLKMNQSVLMSVRFIDGPSDYSPLQ